MGRPRKTEKERASYMLALRLTQEDHALLAALKQKKEKELASSGVEVTITSVLRGLIRQASAGLRGRKAAR